MSTGAAAGADGRVGGRAWAPPSGRTAVAGVVGDPVAQSLSPALHNAAFAALGLDWVYVAFPVSERDAPVAFAGAVALGVRGLSVTMPHKRAAAESAARRSEEVELLGAANTIVVESGTSVAHTTDGAGLLADLRESEGFDASGRRCVVVGAGGAARAVVLSLARAGASSVVVVNRTHDRAEVAAALAGRAGRVGGVESVDAAELVVNATPVGMSAGAGSSRDGGLVPSLLDDVAARLSGGQLAVDLVYAPARTPFLLEAERRGAAVRSGLGMLVHQAALQLALWTGEVAPLDAMWRAVGGREP